MAETRQDAKDMRGKVCVVTGANTGIGKVTARELARRGAHVILTARSQAVGDAVAAEIREETSNPQVEAHPLELGELAQVERSARALAARDLPIHVLVNNAGLAGQRGQTADGFELHFGVNHLGTFLFTTLLLDRLRAAAPARIVNVASQAHSRIKEGIDFDALRRPTSTLVGMDEYGVSKLANILFTRELARRLDGSGVTTYALHPGVVGTDVWRRIPWPIVGIMRRFMLTPEEGARTTLYCATDPSLEGVSGRYYDDGREREPSRLARDPALAEELWRRSEEYVAAALRR